MSFYIWKKGLKSEDGSQKLAAHFGLRTKFFHEKSLYLDKQHAKKKRNLIYS